MAFDTSDSDCSNVDNFTQSAILSNYDSATGSFVPGNLRWTGSFVFREDPNLSLTSNVNSVVGQSSTFNTTDFTFKMYMLVPSCSS